MITWGKYLYIVQILDKGLILLIVKKLLELEDKIKSPAEKWAKDMNRQFTETRNTDGSHIFKKILSLTQKSMQIETAPRYHFLPIRLAQIQSLTISSSGAVGKQTLTHTAHGKAECHQLFSGLVGNFC